MATADLNGAHLYYEKHGRGETVILTHGSWGDATAWQGVVSDLAERFEVVIWDRRGHSRSSGGSGTGLIEEDADDLAALIGYLGLERVHLYGTSSGGTVVLKLVAARPGLVRSLAIHEPAVPDVLAGTSDDALARELAKTREHLAQVGDQIRAGNHESAAEYFVENVALGVGAWHHMPASVREGFIRNAPTFLEELSDPRGLDVETDPVAKSRVPILITMGTSSPRVLIEAALHLSRQIPTATTAILEGAGHVPYRTHPELWVETLVGFVESVGRIETTRGAGPG